MVPSVYLDSSVCRSLQCLISTLKQWGEGILLFTLTCSVMLWGGRNTANKYHWCVWGVLTVSGPHWVCPHSQHVCFPSLHCSGSRLLCREQALGCVHCPGLSHSGSGSQVLHKGADLVGPAFCALPGPSSSGDQVLGERSCPKLGAATYCLPGTCHLIFWVYNWPAFSDVPCVSSGELISVCNSPRGC